jgi:nitrile hydratase subunit beta
MDRTPATHDLGGAARFSCTAVEPDDNAPPDAFGREVDTIRQLLSARGLLRVDELRRAIEAIPPDEYHALSYYERWLRAMCALMVEKGVLAPESLA